MRYYRFARLLLILISVAAINVLFTELIDCKDSHKLHCNGPNEQQVITFCSFMPHI